MKFKCSIDINLPREKVVELYNNPDNLGHWQDGFVEMEQLSGTSGEVGAKSKMIYEVGNRQMEITETILVSNLPEEFTGRYEHIHMVNTMKNTFTALNENQTRWEADVEYTKFNGFVPKLMAFLFPGIFKKQVQKWLYQFKAFAESEFTSA